MLVYHSASQCIGNTFFQYLLPQKPGPPAPRGPFYSKAASILQGVVAACTDIEFALTVMGGDGAESTINCISPRQSGYFLGGFNFSHCNFAALVSLTRHTEAGA